MSEHEPRNRSDAFHHRNLPHLLLHVRETLMAHFRPVLNEAGVTEQQWRVLRVLSEDEPLEPNQIARTCQILSPSLTRMLAGMEASGLISRERLDADQRRQEISLTPKSRELIKRMRPVVDQRYQQLEATIGAELMDRLYRDLDQAAALIKGLADGKLVDGKAESKACAETSTGLSTGTSPEAASCPNSAHKV